jgi:hypothetical protein
MYAQLIHCGTTPDRRAELDRVIRDRLMPALIADPGFVGTLNLARPTADDAMLIILWISREHAARPLSTRSLQLRRALAAITALANESERRPQVWEVAAQV